MVSFVKENMSTHPITLNAFALNLLFERICFSNIQTTCIYNDTDLHKENVEYLKKELNSKDELIKPLIDTQNVILETIRKSKRNEKKDICKLNQV